MNEHPKENNDFDFKDLNTLKNHWIKVDGSKYKGKNHGLCKVKLFRNEKLFINFKHGIAEGKGIYEN